jgi:L-lysine 6-transaminase
MVRSRRVLEIIESEALIEQAGPKGEQLVLGLEQFRDESGLISNVRGRGLFVAFDLETREQRDAAVTDLHKVERVIVLPCGERSIRFRPALSVSQDEIDDAIGATRRSVLRVASKELQYT